MEQLSLASFLANGHEYHLYAYEPIRNVPGGVTMMDASEILPRSRAFQYSQHATWAGFANFFRYKLLLERGGWWADTDLICLRTFDFPEDYVFSSEFSVGRQMVNIGAIKSPAGSDVMAYPWEVCQTKDPTKLVWGETGPELMEEAVEKFSMQRYVRDWKTFCPIGFRAWRVLMNPDVDEPESSTYAIHLWHEMWRAAKQDKNTHYHPASLYERLRRRYLGPQDRVSIETAKAVLAAVDSSRSHGSKD
ncbi:MAG: glycosyltransferase [Gemmatimonadales bacterium]